MTKKESFDEINSFLTLFTSSVDQDIPIVIIANKVDLRNDSKAKIVSKNEGEILAKSLLRNKNKNRIKNVFFIEGSAINNINVESIFEFIAEELFRELVEKESHNNN